MKSMSQKASRPPKKSNKNKEEEEKKTPIKN
jgi:hypothetical protein